MQPCHVPTKPRLLRAGLFSVSGWFSHYFEISDAAECLALTVAHAFHHPLPSEFSSGVRKPLGTETSLEAQSFRKPRARMQQKIGAGI